MGVDSDSWRGTATTNGEGRGRGLVFGRDKNNNYLPRGDRGRGRSHIQENITIPQQEFVQVSGERGRGGRGRGRGRGRGINRDNITQETNKITNMCESMCPETEILERIEFKQVNRFEMSLDPITNVLSPDPLKMIKRFTRLSGETQTKTQDIRSIKALTKTCGYIFKTLIPTQISLHGKSIFGDIYLFIFDRTKSIRQDVIRQNFKTENQLQTENFEDFLLVVNIYSQIIRFYIISSHLLRSAPTQIFDRTLNYNEIYSSLNSIHIFYKSILKNKNSTLEMKKGYIEFIEYSILLELVKSNAYSTNRLTLGHSINTFLNEISEISGNDQISNSPTIKVQLVIKY